jgi:hypothetical protein
MKTLLEVIMRNKVTYTRSIAFFLTFVLLLTVCTSACERKNEVSEYQEDWNAFCIFLNEQPEVLDYRLDVKDGNQRGRVFVEIYVDYREWDHLDQLIEDVILPQLGEKGIHKYLDEQVKDVPVSFIFSPDIDRMGELVVRFIPGGYKTTESPYYTVQYYSYPSEGITAWHLERRIDDGIEFKEHIYVENSFEVD